MRSVTTPTSRRLQILTYAVHERYQSNLAALNADFWCITGSGLKGWEPKYAPLPDNHRLVTIKEVSPRAALEALPEELDLDVVWSQNKYAHFQLSRDLARYLHVPLVSIEHCLPPPGMHPAIKAEHYSHRGDINLFITDYNRREWGWPDGSAQVLHHGVDTELFCPGPWENRHPTILSVVNKWKERTWACGYNLWEAVVRGLPADRIVVRGDNPGLSSPCDSPQELAGLYRSTKIFLNTSLVSPIPSVLLEAMASGAACVSTNNCAIPEIITSGENGLLGNTPEELRGHIDRLLIDDDLARQLGENARKTILDRFSLPQFVHNWDVIFREVAPNFQSYP